MSVASRVIERVVAEPGTLRMFVAKRLPVRTLCWVPICWTLLLIATLKLRLVRFARLERSFGVQLGAIGLTPLVRPQAIRQARRWQGAIAMAARLAPFRADCLPQAMVAARLCRLFAIPYALQLGCARRSTDTTRAGIAAHAWVNVGPVTVSGGAGSCERFTPVACYAPQSLDPRR